MFLLFTLGLLAKQCVSMSEIVNIGKPQMMGLHLFEISSEKTRF